MTTSRREKPFTARFVEAEPTVLLELMNTTDRTLKCVEILSIFLKDEETSGGGPSRANIKFEAVKSMQPKEKVVLSHRTWIDGKPSDSQHDQLARLQTIDDGLKPYVLDISWEDPDGRSQFQRIPVGH
ncbi:MAG TPA: hypothetical protein VEX60_08170 [Pyrinomonadaceae bacterium]|nr:hypothetical protein [Pyrinomonadaceae bacterium]